MNQEIAAYKLQFKVQLSATRRGARLARLLATEELRSWGLPFDTPAQVIAELAANAATHGCVPGRDFRLAVLSDADTLRIEVTDARGERLPDLQASEVRESGNGLVLVDALADRWGISRGPFPCKTVWAEFDLPMWGR
ncbi:ATP-binding protein [Streptomyces sp. ISID311]|uniref:ATP-binding protein n=1 Tax=Streptomyces sp. ISID311 TaxID=2601673 RepID=UPI0011BD3878|nr:ATP-binding protein [Streptomyces sp. ISID311]TXC97717.1 ATP-binding protein [Streptomyces sp. ISID311]